MTAADNEVKLRRPARLLELLPRTVRLVGVIAVTVSVVFGVVAVMRSDDLQPQTIAAGADGNLWFDGDGAIGRMTPTGDVTRFEDGIDGSDLRVAAGPDGNIWFSDFDNDRVGRITPSGKVVMFSAGITRGSGPFDITAGPDGNVWFTEPTIGRVARITPRGEVTEFAAGITPRSGLSAITTGSDGNLWFGVLADPARIARITPHGVVTEFSKGLDPQSSPWAFTAGADGNVWFTESAGSARVGRVTPSGTITEFSAGLSADAQLEVDRCRSRRQRVVHRKRWGPHRPRDPVGQDHRVRVRRAA